MKHPRPDRRTHELDRIWQLLTTNERISWLRLARAMGEKSSNLARIFDNTAILAFVLTLIFPIGLKFALLAIGAGYVLAVNWAIARTFYEGIRSGYGN